MVSSRSPLPTRLRSADSHRTPVDPLETATPSTRRRVLAEAVATWRPFLLLFLAARLALYVTANAAAWLSGDPSVRQLLARAWDGGWYLSIAQGGYPDNLAADGVGNAWAFFPALPLVLRGFSEVTGLSLESSSQILSWVFGAAAAVAVGLCLQDLFGRSAALTGTAAFLFFPTSFVLGMTYTEAPFVASSATALLLARRQRWLMAAPVVAFGALLRPQGVVLLAAFAVACLISRRLPDLRRIAAAALAGSSWAAWVIYQHEQVGTPVAFLQAQAAWGAGDFAWFTTPFRAVVTVLLDGAGVENAHQVLASGALVFMLSGCLALVLLHRRGRKADLPIWVFSIGTVLAAMSPYFASSVLRYSSAAFPLFGALAVVTRPTLRVPIIASLAVIQGGLAVVALASFTLTATTMGTAPFAP
jgi:hypothetical protein